MDVIGRAPLSRSRCSNSAADQGPFRHRTIPVKQHDLHPIPRDFFDLHAGATARARARFPASRMGLGVDRYGSGSCGLLAGSLSRSHSSIPPAPALRQVPDLPGLACATARGGIISSSVQNVPSTNTQSARLHRLPDVVLHRAEPWGIERARLAVASLVNHQSATLSPATGAGLAVGRIRRRLTGDGQATPPALPPTPSTLKSSPDRSIRRRSMPQ